jgi:hypothetical protein
MWLLTLGSIWYLVTIWLAIAENRQEEEKKKGARRRLRPSGHGHQEDFSPG